MSDGIRGLGDYCTFQYNRVTNCFKINDNHDDGFQSWSVGSDGVGTGTVYGVILRGNIFISYTDPAQPYKATLQGIGCFDGMFKDWIVENNVVITDMWHGLSLYGAINCRIINNTVLENPINAFDLTPWIGIYNHKNGTASSGNIIRNNIATSYSSMLGSTVDHNITTTDYNAYFLNYNGFDLHLRNGSPAIDAGSSDGAPGMDIEKNQRPSGIAVDIGAYEFVTGTGTDYYARYNKDNQLKVYPVPFYSMTRISFILTQKSKVNLSVYDLSGRLIRNLLQREFNPGEYAYDWNTSDLPEGVYFCMLHNGYYPTRMKIIKMN
jgi:parallel beta-helix repeat protein